ncbi:MAG: lysine--tRNA ligase [Patescibacteria group bacterium]|nr:lysine--tRNA ligase [Patescibacteria group bacterium]
MYWANKIADEIISSGKYYPYWVDDMKTPSGLAHVGSLMGPVVHSIIYRSLKKRGVDVEFTFVINDFDAVDGLSDDLIPEYSKYLGFPLKAVPSPDSKFQSMADYYADDFINSFRVLGVEAKILSSWQMYHEGKFDNVIKTALDNSEKIRKIYKEVSGSDKEKKGWLPFQVICEKCSKLGTTRVYSWDGKKVSYVCEPNLVEWAQGCGYQGEISPFGGNGKLPWKVDWPAHWKVMGVTIEGAGKDHASKGGSYDIAMALCEAVFDFPKPYKLPYEFLLIGGRKMSSSKGLGLKARDLVKMLPPVIGRFLFAKHNIKRQANFDPYGNMAIPELFDLYDQAQKAYWEQSDENLSAMFEYSQITNKMPKPHFVPRFLDVVNYLQDSKVDIYQKFSELKGTRLSPFEKKVLKERIKYAKIWISVYAPKKQVFLPSDTIPPEVKNLSNAQLEYLKLVLDSLESNQNPEEFQTVLYNLSKQINLPAKEAFGAIYIALIGKPHGPKAAWFLLEHIEVAKRRFREILNL